MFSIRNKKNNMWITTLIWSYVSKYLGWNTVDSRYLELQGTLWNTSRYPYFDISDLRNWGKQLIEQPPLTKWICNLTPKLEIYWKYCGKEEKLLFLLFSTIFCCLLVDLCVITGTRFSLRDKQLFEISEFEITRVDCNINAGYTVSVIRSLPYIDSRRAVVSFRRKNVHNTG